MLKNVGKYQSVFPKPQDNVLKCLVLSTNQRETQVIVINEQRNQKYFFEAEI